MARVVTATFLSGKVTSSARTFRLNVNSDAHQSCLVSVDQIRKCIDFHYIGARSLARLVLDKALVDANHGDIDAHFRFNLFPVLQNDAIQFDWLVIR